MKNLFIVLLLLISNVCISQKVIGYYNYTIGAYNGENNTGKYIIYDDGTSKRVPSNTYVSSPAMSVSDLFYFAPNSTVVAYIKRDREIESNIAAIRNTQAPISSSNRGVSQGTQMSDFNKIQTPVSNYNTTRVTINFNNSSK